MRNINRIGIFAIVFIAALIIWAAAFQGSAQQKELSESSATDGNCNEQNLAGTWIYVEFGTVQAGNPLGLPAGPYNAVGKFTTDGFGNYTVTIKEMINGNLVNTNATGTYTVDGCGVTFYADGLSIPISFGYVTGDHKEALGMSLIPLANKTQLIFRQ